MRWTVATRAAPGRSSEDAIFVSPDGHLVAVADGARSPVAARVCVDVAMRLLAPDAGDELIARIVRQANGELLARCARGEFVGTAGLSLVHERGERRVLAAALRDSPILQIRGPHVEHRVRPLRKYDFFAKLDRRQADSLWERLPWQLRVPLEFHLPYADVTLLPTVEELVLEADDAVIVCTDGVSDAIPPGELARLVAEGRDAAALVSLAADRGSTDDLTCAVGRP